MPHDGPVIISMPLASIQVDPHLEVLPATPDQDRRLRLSVEDLGILMPLVVSDTAAGYKLVDGLRRYAIAKERGIQRVVCVIRPTMSATQRTALRLELNMARSAEHTDEIPCH